MKASKNAERVADTAKHRALRFVRFTKAVGLLLLLAFFVAACSKSEDAEVPLLDSGVFGFDSEPTYWIDDHRVMFVGWLGSKADAHQQDSDFPRKHLLIWDTNSGEVTVYREDAWNLCFYDGFISYLTGDPSLAAISQRKLMTGEFGAEQETMRPKLTKETKRYKRVSAIDCQLWDAPIAFRGSDWIPLTQAGGIISRGSMALESNESTAAYLYGSDGQMKKTLPMESHLIGRVGYFEFNNSYLIQPFAVGFQKKHFDSQCWKYWWLLSDGSVSKNCIPIGPWAERGAMWVVGTKLGPIVVSFNTNGTGDVGSAGAYLLQGNETRKVVSGLVWGPSISRDGCKLAFLYSPGLLPRDVDQDYWISARYIDLCFHFS